MGLEKLIEAIQWLRNTCADVCLVVAGTGSLQSALRLQVEANRLQENVRFAGVLPESDLPDYYAAADLFVLPARSFEGAGLVTLEALACGTPVAGTPAGVAPELLRPLEPGLLFPGMGPADMAAWFRQRIPALLGNRALRERCRAYAVRHYSWESIMLRIELLFYEAAATCAGETEVAPCPRLGDPLSEP
jgi:glycosyltransferase involved in cell wall biosynthesis